MDANATSAGLGGTKCIFRLREHSPARASSIEKETPRALVRYIEKGILAVVDGDIDQAGNLRFQRLSEDGIQLRWTIDTKTADSERFRKLGEVRVAELGADRAVELRRLLPPDAPEASV